MSARISGALVRALANGRRKAIQAQLGSLLSDLEDDISGGGGGGGSPSTATASVTTDADTFMAEHIFDLGEGAHIAQLSGTATALTADGETFGEGPGEIQWLIDTPVVQFSFDGIEYQNRTNFQHLEPAGIAIGIVQKGILLVPRYLKATVAIVDDTFAIYSGPNHPTATVTFDVEWT